MDLSISLIEGGWVVMVDNATNKANLCIPSRPNEITLSFITIEQFDDYDDAKLRAIALVANGITPETYLRKGQADAEDQERLQIEAAATAAATAG